MTAMVFMVPDIYNRIKEKGRQEGLARGRAEGRAEVRAEGRAKGREVVLDAMREAGLDDETRRRVEDALARCARRDEL